MPRIRTGRAPALDEAVLHLHTVDKKLSKLMHQVGACKILINEIQSPFEALAESIVYQQLTGKAAGTIFGRVKASFQNQDALDPHEVLAVEEAVLRTAGCSRAKTLALKDLALKATEGYLPSLSDMHEMSDQELIECLSAIRGIGRWTVEMLLIFRLGRMDVLPCTDYGIRKGFMVTYGLDDLPTPAQITKKAERWKPFRTVGSWYLWRALELEKKPAAKAKRN